MTENRNLKIAADQNTSDQNTSDQNTSNQNTPGQKAPDPFDVEALRLPPSFVETAGVKKILSTVPVRKPHRQEWIWVHPSEAYRGNFATIHLEEDGEFYILTPTVAREITEETISVTIYTVMNRNGVLFLWPVKIPNTDGRGQQWHSSAHEAAEVAMGRWVRVRANRDLGAYEHAFTDNPTSDTPPTWPELSFHELLKLGFYKTGRFVENFEHPVVKKLRG